MGAFIEEEAVEIVPLEREYCDPKPDGSAWHEHDTVTVRTQYSYGDELRINKVGNANPGLYWDSEAATLTLFQIGITDWSFVDRSGEKIPIVLPMIRLLDERIGSAVGAVLNDRYEAARAALPNPSGALSLPSSPEKSSA